MLLPDAVEDDDAARACSATKLASASTSSSRVGERAGVEQVVAVEEVQGRLRHASSYGAGGERAVRRAYERCRRASYSSTAAATLTLSDSTPSASGIETVASQVLRTSGRTPFPLGAEDERDAAREIRLPHRLRRIGGRRVRPQVVALDLREVAREIRDDGDREMLDGAGRRAADGRR